MMTQNEYQDLSERYHKALDDFRNLSPSPPETVEERYNKAQETVRALKAEYEKADKERRDANLPPV